MYSQMFNIKSMSAIIVHQLCFSDLISIIECELIQWPKNILKSNVKNVVPWVLPLHITLMSNLNTCLTFCIWVFEESV